MSHGLGWDLTYMPLLRDNGVCPGDLFCEIAEAKPQPPVNKLFAEWKHEPIVSSILVELPDGHADMAAIWLVRTKNEAYWWTFHPHHPNPDMQPLPVLTMKDLFESRSDGIDILPEAAWGRLWKTLMPVYTVISQQEPTKI